MEWEKKGLIFKPSDAPEFEFTHTQCPTALLMEDRIRVFFGSRLKDGSGGVFYIDVDSENPRRVLSIHGNPVFGKGGIGSFDQDGVLQVCLRKYKNNLAMYYGGFSKTTSGTHTCMMGLAISEDNGDSFARLSEGPVFPISATDPFLIGSADIVFNDNKWHMIYTSGTKWLDLDQKQELAYTLKYANSLDGINWNPTGKVIIPHEGQSSADCKPSIFKIGNTFHMYFSARKVFDYRDYGANSYRLVHATSDDLTDWQLSGAEGKIDPSLEGWDSAMICYPNIIQHNGKIIMFYNGNGFGQSGFGYAELKL